MLDESVVGLQSPNAITDAGTLVSRPKQFADLAMVALGDCHD